MALSYERIDIKLVAGAIANFPIDFSKTTLQGNDFITDSYIMSLQPGIVVGMDAKGYIVPVKDATIQPLGFLVNDAGGYVNQNVNARANGLGAVLVGSGNQFVTDNTDADNIKAGNLLYADANGKLTATKGTATTPVAVALTSNSASNKSLLVSTLI